MSLTLPRNSSTSASEVRAASRPCARCRCDRFEGEGGYCESCGHGRETHPTVAVELIAAACARCACPVFRGRSDARHCASCGHPRELHSLDALGVDDLGADGEPEGSVLPVAIAATICAAAGGGLITLGVTLLA